MAGPDLLNDVIDSEFNSPVLNRMRDYAGIEQTNPLDAAPPPAPAAPAAPTGGGIGGLAARLDADDGYTGPPSLRYDGDEAYSWIDGDWQRDPRWDRTPSGGSAPKDTTGDTRIYTDAEINAYAADPSVKSVTRQGPDILVTYANGSTQRFYAVQGGYKAAAPSGGTSATAPKPTLADFFNNRGVATGGQFGSPQRFGDSNVILPHQSSGGGKDLSGYIYGEDFATGAPDLVGAHIGGQLFREAGAGGPVDMVLAAYGVKPTGQLDQDLKTMSALVDMQTQALATMQAMNPNATEAQAAAVVQAMLPKKATAAQTDESLYGFDPLDLGMVQAEGGTNYAGVGGRMLDSRLATDRFGMERGKDFRGGDFRGGDFRGGDRLEVGTPVEPSPYGGSWPTDSLNAPIPGGYYNTLRRKWVPSYGSGGRSMYSRSLLASLLAEQEPEEQPVMSGGGSYSFADGGSSYAGYPSLEGVSPIPQEGYSRWSRRSGEPIGVDEAEQPWWRFYDYPSGGDIRNIREMPRGSGGGRGGGGGLSHGNYSFAAGGGFTTQEPIVMKGVQSNNIYGVAGGQPERIDVTPLAGTDIGLGRELEEYALQQEQSKTGAAAGAGPIVDTFLRSAGKSRVPYRNTYFPA